MNSKIRATVLFILVLSVAVHLLGQNNPVNENIKIEQLIENIAEDAPEDADYTNIVETLYDFESSPININTCTIGDLSKLVFLNQAQIQNLINYRNQYGAIYSVYEIASIDGFTEEIIKQLLPFIALVQTKEEQNEFGLSSLKHGRHQLFLRSQYIVEDKKGDLTANDSLRNFNNSFLGNKLKIYTRYEYKLGHRIRLGFTAEKDAGEQFFSGSQKNGFDFYSSYIEINDCKFLKKLLIGDYHLNFGEGLVLQNGFSFNKSPLVLNVNKNTSGIKKYSSTDENNFFRGSAVTMQAGRFFVTGFFSSHKKDANSNLTDSAMLISSVYSTGYHRSRKEAARKDIVTQTDFGGDITFRASFFEIGANYIQTSLNAPIETSSKPYKAFHKSRDLFRNYGLHYRANVMHLYFFGEAAISNNSGMAFVNGLLISACNEASISVLHRYYQPEYESIYGNAFSENTSSNNEEGVYISTEIYPFAHFKLSAYADVFRFPWLKYLVDAPSSGKEMFFQLDYNHSDLLNMYTRFKFEQKQRNNKFLNDHQNTLSHVKKSSLRYHVDYTLTSSLSFKNRIELSSYSINNQKESGYLIYQDIKYQPLHYPIAFWCRYALFDTDTWDTRIFAYENDILYAFSVPTYYLKGNRFYIMVKYSYRNKINFWARYSITRYYNKESIGSSYDMIEGNTKSEIKLQVQFKF